MGQLKEVFTIGKQFLFQEYCFEVTTGGYNFRGNITDWNNLGGNCPNGYSPG